MGLQRQPYLVKQPRNISFQHGRQTIHNQTMRKHWVSTPQVRLVKWMFTVAFVTLDGEESVERLIYSRNK